MAKQYASETGHWYTDTGEPMYEIAKKDGKGMRNTTLRDARKLNLFPSVTGVMKELATPQLETWKIEQAVTQAMGMKKYGGETDKQFAMRAFYDAMQQVRDKATDGSAIHGALDQFFLRERYDSKYQPYIDGISRTLKKLKLLNEQWLSEKSFGFGGFGGKVDLHSPNVVADFKTKDFSEDKLPAAYDNHFMQLAAYRAGLKLGNVPGLILFVSTTSPGLVHPVHCTIEQLDKGYAMFQGLLQVWQAKRGYIPIG
jgi:hypothetical protein